MKYRKKPVVVEAFQITEVTRWDNSEWPNWLHQAWQQEPGKGAFWCEGDILFLGTLRGNVEVTFDDYIIQGIHGELYPCKPDIFKETYEIVV